MSDPLAYAVAYGRETGSCSCCGRELSDPISVERGVGPVCLANYRLSDLPVGATPPELVAPQVPDADGSRISQQTLVGIIVAFAVVAILAGAVITVACFCWLKRAHSKPQDETKALFTLRTGANRSLAGFSPIQDADDIKVSCQGTKGSPRLLPYSDSVGGESILGRVVQG
jgi:hypothetical protein